MEHEEVWAGSDAHFPSLHACGFSLAVRWSFRLNSPRTAPPYKDLLCKVAGFPANPVTPLSREDRTHSIRVRELKSSKYGALNL